jgi:anti-sigma B factor antagonist
MDENEQTQSGSPASRYFQLESYQGVTVVNFEDLQLAPDAREPLYALAEDPAHGRIVLNLANVWALTSSGLGILANFQQKAEAAGGRVTLCCVNENLAQMFRLTKFDQVFETHPTQEDAVRAFGEAR